MRGSGSNGEGERERERERRERERKKKTAKKLTDAAARERLRREGKGIHARLASLADLSTSTALAERPSRAVALGAVVAADCTQRFGWGTQWRSEMQPFDVREHVHPPRPHKGPIVRARLWRRLLVQGGRRGR